VLPPAVRCTIHAARSEVRWLPPHGQGSLPGHRGSSGPSRCALPKGAESPKKAGRGQTRRSRTRGITTRAPTRRGRWRSSHAGARFYTGPNATGGSCRAAPSLRMAACVLAEALVGLALRGPRRLPGPRCAAIARVTCHIADAEHGSTPPPSLCPKLRANLHYGSAHFGSNHCARRAPTVGHHSQTAPASPLFSICERDRANADPGHA
jgi:hypothetical protein